MLGLDGLRGQVMQLDFRTRRITVGAARWAADDPHTIVVTARSRYGGLVLVDARAGRTPVYVILDTGAQGTVANEALRQRLIRRGPDKLDGRTEVISVSGQVTPAQWASLPYVTFGGVGFENLPVAFADLHTFARFDLADRPAMLLGMDVLQLFDKVSVDFGHRTVSFHMHDTGRGAAQIGNLGPLRDF